MPPPGVLSVSHFIAGERHDGALNVGSYVAVIVCAFIIVLCLLLQSNSSMIVVVKALLAIILLLCYLTDCGWLSR